MNEMQFPKEFPSADALVRQVELLWAQGQRPDPDALLKEAGVTTPLAAAEVLAADQWQRWHAGERIAVEDYFARHPSLAGHPAPALLLVYGEFLVREELGETPSLQTYLARFPQCADGLRRQLSFRAAVAEEIPPVVEAAGASGVVAVLLGTLEHYELLEEIGRGGMGVVYRCGDSALGRDLALKVLRAELRGHKDAEERFLREARLTGALQHPGVVPIHSLGRLTDGRPGYAMKLVRGRTLTDILGDEPAGPEHLPRLPDILEKVCQALAFAHSRGVIHRDLKPSNVMVGEFGEVQVMDWGLAKEMRSGQAATRGSASANGETGSQTEAGLSRVGQTLGTPAYMPPEQAAGDWDSVDERADVFALGAILCEALMGRPPYPGDSFHEVLDKARRGDLAETLGRLEQCGADAVVMDLCRECLAAECWQRPRHAGVVADRLAAYQAEVRERLRRAEVERARAGIQAREERKRRRLRAALALAALLLVSGGAVVWWQGQRRQAEADGAVAVALGEARALGEQARTDPLTPIGYDKAVAGARKAAEMARAGGASEVVQQQSEELLGKLQAEAETAAKDRRLLARLLEAPGPREGPKYNRDNKGMMTALAEPTAEEQFVSAFRDWGLDVDEVPAAEAAARLKARPTAVVSEVIAALDEWASQRRVDQKPEAARRVAELAAALDVESGSLRRELRAILEWDRLPAERALGMLSAALRPVPLPVTVPWGRDGTRLRQLAERMDPAVEPVLGLVTLTRALLVAGEEALAERLLRDAVQARRGEVVLYHTLGQLLTGQDPPRWAEAVEFYRAASALRPDLGVNLARALLDSGKQREGLGLLARLVKESPDNPYLHFQQAHALHEKHDWDGAIACFQKALDLDPKDAAAHNGLGVALMDKGDLDGAIACYQKALALNPKLALAQYNLGVVLHHKGDLDGALACYQKSLALNPKNAPAHNNLGLVLMNKGDLDGAIACYRKALELDSKYAEAHCNLGHVLQQQGRFTEAVADLRRGHKLGSRRQDWPYPSAQWLRDAERLAALDGKLPGILQGDASPADADAAVTLAQMCQQHKKRHVASARLYADAFTAQPKLAADPNQQHRYNAACSAALAAAGQGEDTRLLPDKVVVMFRLWALGWLRDDLTAYAKIANQNNLALKEAIQQRLVHWRGDADLISVRDPQALDSLGDNERAAWQTLWREVDELLTRLARKDEPTQGRKEPETPKTKP